MDALSAGQCLVGLGIYVGAGVAFALPFLIRGAARIDPAANGATTGFRIAILPGVILFWPWLAWRWRRAERSAS